MVRRILELTGPTTGLVRHVDDRPGHDRRYAIDDVKLHALGWAPSGRVRRTGSPRRSRGTRAPRLVGADQSGEFREYYERQYAERLAAADGRSLHAVLQRAFDLAAPPRAAARAAPGTGSPRRTAELRPATCRC